MEKTKSNPALSKFSQRNWRIAELLVETARGLGKPPAQVALNWVATQPGITSTIIGATKLSQLEDNLASLSFEIPRDVRARLDEATAPEAIHPYVFYRPSIQAMISGGAKLQRWMAAASV